MTQREGPGRIRLSQPNKPNPSGPETRLTAAFQSRVGLRRLSGRRTSPGGQSASFSLSRCVKDAQDSSRAAARTTTPFARCPSFSSVPGSAPPLPVGHVSLRDRLPPVQVDHPPAAALRHHFRHHRHRRSVGMGRGRGRQVPLRQHVGPVPRQERPLGLQVAHGAPLGAGGRCPDDHRPARPHRRLHRLHSGHVLRQHPPAAVHRRSADRCRGGPGHRPHHLPRQIQRADLRGQLLLHLGLRLRLGRHHHLHRLRHPLLLPAPLRGGAARRGQGQIHLHLVLETERLPASAQ